MTDTITVWNRWREALTGKDRWHRHVVDGCAWRRSVEGDAMGIGGECSVMIAANPAYVDRRDWEAMDEAGRDAHFSLWPGVLVARGDVDARITGVPPDTEAGLRAVLGQDGFCVRGAIDATGGGMRGGHYRIWGV